jgi:hypothetical protein
MPRSKKGIGSHHNSGTGHNSGMVRTTPCDSRCYSCSKSHSATHKQSRSPVVAVPPLQDSANHPQLPSPQSHSVSCSSTTPQPKTGAMPTHRNGTSTSMSQHPSSQPSVSFSNTSPPPNPSAIHVPHNGTTPTSHQLASPVATPLSNRESHNHYGGIVDVTRLTPSQ